VSYNGYGTSTGSDLSELQSEVSSLRFSLRQLSDVPTELESLRDDVRELQRWKDEAFFKLEQIEELEEGASELKDQISGLDSIADRLGTRLTWLENYIRASGDVILAQLDAGDGDAKQIRAIRAGRDAAADLLTESRRMPHRFVITRYDEAYAQAETAEAAIRVAVEQLACTDRRDAKHAKAATEMRAARATLEDSMETCSRLKTQRAEAIAVLKADDALAAQLAGTIAAGQRAEAALTTRLRTRLVDAIGERAMLPVWFTTPFGPTAPATGAQAWLDVAAQVLLYRAVYRAADPVMVLGPKPADNAPGHQKALYYHLVDQVRRYG
jgi:chromosome segregation ATPase